jgi:ubiquinone/menaquinone biosynthesis C-methylase UbiE
MSLQQTFTASEIHDEWVSVYRSNPLQDSFNNQIMDRLMRYLRPRPGACFLDAGCGTGEHSIRIARRGYKCVGVDISQSVLHKAQKRAADSGLNSNLSFVCQGLEDLALPDNVFDVVHCRGVLMHIPDWERALAHLCRVLKPGGRIVILESNHTSLETAIVLLVRRAKTSASQMIRTPGGLEQWSEKNGNPFVVRTANVKYLMGMLQTHGIDVVKRLSTEFWDINRFPPRTVRDLIIRFNQLSFLLRSPAFLSVANGIIGEKHSR